MIEDINIHHMGLREKLKKNIIHSMSRIGKCIDNGPMKSF